MIEDDSDNECLGNDFERSQDYRAETLRYARDCMGLSCDKPCEIPSPIIGSLKIVGEAIRDAYNLVTKILPLLLASSTDILWIEQRERLSSEMGIIYRDDGAGASFALELNKTISRGILGMSSRYQRGARVSGCQRVGQALVLTTMIVHQRQRLTGAE